MTDELRRVLLDIATPAFNAETIFHRFPRNQLFADPALCPSCQDATVERGDECDECKAELRREREARLEHAQRHVELMKKGTV